MPFRSKKPSSRFLRNRKKFKKKFRRRHIPLAMPNRMHVKLRYLEAFNANTAAIEDKQFSGNNILDPGLTADTSSAAGAAEWLDLYESFRVEAVKAKVKIINYAGTGATSLRCAITGEDDNTAISTVALMEQALSAKQAREFMVGPLGGNNIASITKYFKSRNIFAGKDYNDTQYQGGDSAGPTSEWYIHLVTSSVDETTNTNCRVQVWLEYYVTFFNPRQLGNVA